MIKLMNGLKDVDGASKCSFPYSIMILCHRFIISRLSENAERSVMRSAAWQSIPHKKLLAFPFRVCSRHFNTKSADLSTPIVPNINLPEKPLFFREVSL